MSLAELIDGDEPMPSCTVCGHEKPPEAFQTYKSRGAFYTRTQCKECVYAKINAARSKLTPLERHRQAIQRIRDRSRVKTATELGL